MKHLKTLWKNIQSRTPRWILTAWATILFVLALVGEVETAFHIPSYLKAAADFTEKHVVLLSSALILLVLWREILIERSLRTLLTQKALFADDVRALALRNSFREHYPRLLEAINNYRKSFPTYDTAAQSVPPPANHHGLNSVYQGLKTLQAEVDNRFADVQYLASYQFSFNESAIYPKFAEPKYVPTQAHLPPDLQTDYQKTWVTNQRNLYYIQHLVEYLRIQDTQTRERVEAMIQYKYTGYG
jgi:hypothetical protein